MNLERRAREASARNRDIKLAVVELKDQVLELKNEVLGHGTCGCWVIEQYSMKQTGEMEGEDGGERWRRGSVGSVRRQEEGNGGGRGLAAYKGQGLVDKDEDMDGELDYE
jgi:hypothetical protein